MEDAAQESAGREDDGPRAVHVAACASDAGDPAGHGRSRTPARGAPGLDEEVGDGFFEDGEVGDACEAVAHGADVGLAVALGAGASDGGPFAAVEEAVLDGGRIGDLGHQAAEGVDFADDLALGEAADGGVAGHLGDAFGGDGEQRGPCAEASGGGGGLAAGVAGADDEDVERGFRHGRHYTVRNAAPRPCSGRPEQGRRAECGVRNKRQRTTARSPPRAGKPPLVPARRDRSG